MGEEKQVYTVPEICKILNISKMTAYKAIRKGDIPSIRIGKKILIPKTALERMLKNE